VPVWGWFAIAGGALLLIVAGAALGVLAWRSYERRQLLRLLVRAEAVEALASGLIDSFERLARSSDTELEVFADEPTSSERNALTEIQSRATLLYEELDSMALPRKLIVVAEALADAAYIICEQSSLVRSEDTGELVLDQLISIDLQRVRAYADKARIATAEACDVCGLDEKAVYGGGLYL